MPDKLTDAEIKKALECCSKDDCDNCPNTFGNCYSNLAGYALDLINRQEAENEKNENIIRIADKTIATLNAENENLKAEVERLLKAIQVQEIMLDNQDYAKKRIKAEAYKECIEKVKLKSSSCVATKNGIVVAGSRTYTVSEINLANLLNELVGDGDAK
jgi:hypothetical protein